MSHFEIVFCAVLGLFAIFSFSVGIFYLRTEKTDLVDNEPSTNPQAVHDALPILGIKNSGKTMDNQEVFSVPFESVGIK